ETSPRRHVALCLEGRLASPSKGSKASLGRACFSFTWSPGASRRSDTPCLALGVRTNAEAATISSPVGHDQRPYRHSDRISGLLLSHGAVWRRIGHRADAERARR